MIGIFLV